MTFRPLHAVLSLALGCTAAAGEPDLVTPAAPPAAGGFDLTRYLNVADARYVGSFGMDFENSVGDVDAHAFQVSAFLSKPIDLFAGWELIPQFSYEAMLLSTSGPVPSFLVGDEDLHEIELSLFLLNMSDSSPWIYGAWVNPSLATDFQGVGSDDFFLDVAGALAYRFSDRFIGGIGFGGLNLTGDSAIYPGVGFFWQPTGETLVALYGPTFRATHELNPKWRVGFEFRPNGGIWNTDTAFGSMNLDYTNFRAGLVSSHNIAGDLWLSYGGGMTLGGSLNVTTPDGSRIFQNQLDELESGFYGFVGLDLKSW
jgi:hypothetical protein